MTSPGRRAVFVDRDGIINALVPDPESGLPESPNHLEELALLPAAASAINSLSAAGFLVVCVTNQPAAAKEKTSVDELLAIQREIEVRLGREDARFDGVEICLHHPEGSDPALTLPCDCRKPAPGLLLAAATRLGIVLGRSWMVGDSDSDVVAGHRAGCRAVLVAHHPSAHRRGGDVRPEAVADDLPAAVGFILAQQSCC